MNTIRKREELGRNVVRYVVDAPLVATHRKPGQFVIIRVTDHGERIPLTIADANPEMGTISLIVQSVGKTTREMAMLRPGNAIHDIVGPLGRPTHIQRFGTVLCVGGGIGIAPLYPIAKGMKEARNRVITVLGARAHDLLILEDDMRNVSDELIVTTDDGSYGTKGLVTDAIRSLMSDGTHIDQAVVIGPPLMMKFTSLLTKELGIPTMASLNPIMIDGTGLCGGCRVTVSGEIKFACVDGPEFDAHVVDWDSMIRRLGTYRTAEQVAADRYDHECRVGLDAGESR
ncbi:sulfide/dihydroorotate dehydrogenase-like FAD/NAD-binding protein [Candidatus Cryosericum septentrionale]|jgi:NAD(P)H-flavin reductase|uniref:Sulfide/dihydroorotate dehydrogenase-like FAD/NAD-binding protein n=1 Tax=Candidatus Cryosericum septentrionale TaxID=2290913 RepID=A0A398DKT8_9BACT|nr:sulfide/dihydroorotate dehydrogenase-like FAD/NAD-binding protein [Candidatus Cryosericum septentrionale]RIE16172.1 sulfide/dihydroorotate dehydrogenase-like FAD/NAD-binding protein [Candidatus Cryosericum septentrionale]